MAILNNSNAITTTGGYDVNNSLRFRRSANAHLSRTSSFSGTTNTISFWIKRGELGTRQVIFGWSDNSSNALYFQFINDNLDFTNLTSGSYNATLGTTQVFRDPSAWYHIVLVIDTTNATSSNRLRLHINGSQVTAVTATYPAQNTSLQLGNSRVWNIGREGNTGNNPGDYYLAEWNFIEGQALTPSSFGETDTTTGVWKPKAYTGTYGTNGFYLKFSDIATTSGSNTGLGRDFSGNGNFWNTNNISVTSGTTYDAMRDSPTLTSATVANYANFSGTNLGTFANATITEAGLRVSVSAGGTPDGGKAYAPFGMSDGSGKWYFEMTCVDPGASNQRLCFGIANITTNPNSTVIANAYIASASGAHGNFNIGTFTTNDILQVAYDATTNKLWFGKNNTWFNSGNPAAGTTPIATVTSGITYAPFSHYASGGGGPGIGAWNFGQRPFSYTPPSGFVAVNTFNIPTSTIVKGNSYMDATLYTGNGSNRSITNAAGFRPDLVWGQARSAAYGSWLYDAVRGATKQIESFGTNAESTQSTMVTAFNSNGFNMGTDTAGNQSGVTYVAWQWQAGSSTATNTSGTISSQVRANATTGFSIVTYTGNSSSSATVGHGLGVAPSVVMTKNRTNSGHSFSVRHPTLTSTQNIALQNTDGAYTVSSATSNGGIGTLTSTTFGFISGTVGLLNVNASSNNYVAYCWAEIAGFSRFGSYTGNGSSDGTFVFTGFSPKYLMIKSSSIAGEWAIYDVPRDLYNPMGLGGGRLRANTAAAETSADSAQYIDFLSNGFKIRNTSGFDNQSGATYIYMAFASNPFKNSNAF